MAGVADPRPARRVRDPEAGKEKVRSEGRCRVCLTALPPYFDGGPPLRSLTRAHLVPKGMGGGGGDDVDANIMPLCGMGPGTCHAAMEANDEETRHLIRLKMTPEEEDYVRQKKGHGWLNTRFPA